MVAINYASREVACKIVFYGPGLSGKTTNLLYVHKKVPATTKGKMISLATEADRTLYFDFLPINIGKINGFSAKFQLYTVPGQVYYNATRKLVLRGVDGLVFVADSQADKMDENIESLTNLKENLAEYGYNISELPIVIQYNKRDLPGALPVAELEAKLNPYGWKHFEAEAVNGPGVFDTLKMIIKLVLEKAKNTRSDSTIARTESSPLTPPTAAPATEHGEVPDRKVGTGETIPGMVRHNAYDADTGKISLSPPIDTVPGLEPTRTGDTGKIPAENPAPMSTDEAAEPQQPVGAAARPFPGSSTSRLMRRERRITVSDFQPASRTEESSQFENRMAEGEEHSKVSMGQDLPSPTMAPPQRIVKKKRGFFKRLFGIN